MVRAGTGACEEIGLQGYRLGRVLRRAMPLFFVCAAASRPLVSQTDSAFRRNLDRLELGLNGAGLLNHNRSGENYANSNPKPAQAETLNLNPGNTVGALVTIRYTRSPLVGAEFNFLYGRYTQKFVEQPGNGQSCQFIGTTPCSINVQNNVNAFTVGYVAHLPSALAFGLKPFGAVGVGTTEFKPTTFGGQSLKPQARMTYYYAAGVDEPVLNDHVAIRLQFRQSFFLAPDFQQNYLTIKQRTSTLEPAIGFVLRF